MFCAYARPRYQVSVCRTIGPLVSFVDENYISKQNSPRRDAAFAASHLGLFCLPMFHKKDARVIYYSKKVLHQLIFTTFLSNVLYKNTNFFFKYNTAVEGWTHCLTQQ